MWNTEPKQGVTCWQKLQVAAEEESRFITICPLTIICIICIIVLLTKAIGVPKSKGCVNRLEITQIDFQPVFSMTDQYELKKKSKNYTFNIDYPKRCAVTGPFESLYCILPSFSLPQRCPHRHGAEQTLTRVDDRNLLHLFSFGKVKNCSRGLRIGHLLWG